MNYARIIGTGHYLPDNIVTNEDLEKTLETSDEWITSRTGIKQRYHVTNETTIDLARNASLKALEAANINAKDLDLIIVATTTPDNIFPSTASWLQSQLGADCGAFDLQAVCAGFIYALITAEQYIKAGTAKKILVVGAETNSKILNFQDRNTAVLFGDGAGAVVLSHSEQTGILHSSLHSNGNYRDSLYVSNDDHTIHMKGNEVFKIAVNYLSEAAEQILAKVDLGESGLDWMVPHQANIRIIEAVARRIKQPLSKIIITVDQHANTSAASIPMALDVAVRDGRIKKGDSCLLEGIGGGFTWGSALLRY